MAEVERPRQSKQSSRKGKRAWRKHVDIDDVEAGLEDIREQERTVGTSLDKLDSNTLFTLDTEGNQNAALKRYPKRLKMDEILAERSKTPVIDSRKRPSENSKKSKKIQQVDHKDISKLMKRAKRSSNNQLLTEIEDNATKLDDIWGDEDEEVKTNSKTSSSLQGADISYKRKENPPSTMKREPIQFTTSSEAVEVPHEGRSYNPSMGAWRELLEEEYKVAEQDYNKQQEFLVERAKIERLIAENDEAEASSSESEEQQDDSQDESESVRLSINEPVQVKIKTRTQRNREKRVRERQELEQKLRQVKKQIKQMGNTKQVLKNVENKIQERSNESQEKSILVKPRKRRLGKHNVAKSSLDVKLSDELNDSLRLLKAEGNLFRDRFRRLQERGIIEARIPVTKKRKYKLKLTEKWSYKDFK